MIKEILLKINDIKKENAVLAIDGRASAGKTTLAQALASVLDCNVICMDDFFLPFDMRTKKRLEEPGGNVHYERFKEEVIDNLKNDIITYEKFDCQTGAFSEKSEVKRRPITIIEGSYSHHPYFGDAYDLKLFCDISPELQKDRILKRDGSAKLERYISEWIPKENKYFETYGIKEKSDIVIEA